MSVSKPSVMVYSVDVPEPKNLSATFQYNYFTQDESITDTGAIPAKFLKRRADEVDTTFIQYATTRTPRLVKLEFSPVTLSSNVVGKRVQSRQGSTLISDNFDKIVTEDRFAAGDFAGVTFHDSQIDDKMFSFVSASYAIRGTFDDSDPDVNPYTAASTLSSVTSKGISKDFLVAAMTQPTKNSNVRFHKANGERIFEHYFNSLKNVSANAQISTRHFYDIVNRSLKDPNSQFGQDLQAIREVARTSTLAATKRSKSVNENSFKTFVPFVSAAVKPANGPVNEPPEIVGYVIDKVEIFENGSTRLLDPIIIESSIITSTADFRVKYNAKYAYSVRAIVQFTLTAIESESGEIASLKVLVSSKPSNVSFVQTIETVAPPPPVDLNFTWDYERVNPTTAQFDVYSGQPLPGTGVAGSLMIHWTFPPNPQRDIKRFQVFRRKTVNEPFELIKIYDFDDSAIRYNSGESPTPSLIEYGTSPTSFMFDDDFYVGTSVGHDNLSQGDNEHAWSSTFIYAVCAVDAHGYSSNYSAQFEVWFDPFKNKLQKKLVSHSGAPKPYPNLYLERDAFVDTMRVSGEFSKRARLYFHPQYYALQDAAGNLEKMVATKSDGASYRLQVINTDNQKSATVTINVDDRLKIGELSDKKELQVARRKSR